MLQRSQTSIQQLLGTALILIFACLGGVAAGLGVATTAAFASVLVFVLVLMRSVASPFSGLTWFLTLSPYVGILGVALYPQTYLADGARDLLLALPLYIATAMHLRTSEFTLKAPGLVVVVGAIVLTSTLYMALSPTWAVGVIGVRGWLFFMPMLWVGAHCGATLEGRQRIARTISAAAIPVCLVGLGESALLMAGRQSVLERIYGPAAHDIFYNFRDFGVGGGSLFRVPSTFTYPLAYFTFTLTALCFSIYLLSTASGSRLRRMAGVAVMLEVASILSGGQRIAFVVLPVMLIVLLLTRTVRFRLSMLAGIAAAGGGILMALGMPMGELARHLLEVGKFERDGVLIEGFATARAVTFAGLGTGSDTNAARAVYDDLFAVTGGWQESYFVKAWIEFGILGMTLIVSLFIALAVSLRARFTQAGDSERRVMAATALTLVAAIAVLSIKASPLDQAPAGPMFWLAVGMALAGRRRKDPR